VQDGLRRCSGRRASSRSIGNRSRFNRSGGDNQDAQDRKEFDSLAQTDGAVHSVRPPPHIRTGPRRNPASPSAEERGAWDTSPLLKPFGGCSRLEARTKEDILADQMCMSCSDISKSEKMAALPLKHSRRKCRSCARNPGAQLSGCKRIVEVSSARGLYRSGTAGAFPFRHPCRRAEKLPPRGMVQCVRTAACSHDDGSCPHDPPVNRGAVFSRLPFGGPHPPELSHAASVHPHHEVAQLPGRRFSDDPAGAGAELRRQDCGDRLHVGGTLPWTKAWDSRRTAPKASFLRDRCRRVYKITTRAKAPIRRMDRMAGNDFPELGPRRSRNSPDIAEIGPGLLRPESNAFFERL